MVSLLLGVVFFAVSLGFYVVTRTLKQRQKDWKAFAQKNELTFDEGAFEVVGALGDLEVRIHDKLAIDQASKLGASMPVGSTAVVVDVRVPGCPEGLLVHSRPPRLAPRKLGSALVLAARPASFAEAFTAEPHEPTDLAPVEDENVQAALLAVVSNRWYRGLALEQGKLSAFHVNPAFGSPQDAEELERTVGLALEAASALRDACAARQPKARKRTPQPAKSRRGPSAMKRVAGQ